MDSQFFSRPDVNGTVQRLLRYEEQAMTAAKIPESPASDFQAARALIRFFSYAVQQPASVDEHCQQCINYLGGPFFDILEGVASAGGYSPEQREVVIAMAYAFVVEFTMNDPRGFEKGAILAGLEIYLYEHGPKVKGFAKQAFVYATMKLPFDFIRTKLSEPSAEGALSLSAKITEAKKIIDGWDDLFAQRNDGWTQELERREERVKELVSEFRGAQFSVGLEELRRGFHDMREKKAVDLAVATTTMRRLAWVALAPAVIELIMAVIFWEKLKDGSILLLYIAPAIFILQFLLVYFFRISLIDQQAIKAQILQLDLREALCKFVQPYVDFAERTKRAENPALEKFESLIFSGIVATGENIPSTFDGLDQLGKLLEAMRGKP